jgi:branched-subunit amino acid ABC-type transport system permease component
MTTFTELLLNGLSMGSVYALIALGFVVIFRATEVVNFAHASLLLAGGYITASLHDDLGFWPALLVGAAAPPWSARPSSSWSCAATGAPTTRLRPREARVAVHPGLALLLRGSAGEGTHVLDGDFGRGATRTHR